jgi:phosphoribosylformylglycinamidine cyclo-ligase
MEGIARGCELAGTALVGGETAEMPGMYSHGDYDLAGFCVGVVEKNQIIDGSWVNIGDVLIGLEASGPHANGYSLIRKILQDSGDKLSDPFGEGTLGETLLTPTRIYVKSLLELMKSIEVHALAHITGGGLLENLPRVLPPDTCAVVDANSWQRPAIFNWLQERGKVKDTEMLRTFNCGVGMVVCVAPQDVETGLHILRRLGETAWPIGVVLNGSGEPQVKLQV